MLLTPLRFDDATWYSQFQQDLCMKLTKMCCFYAFYYLLNLQLLMDGWCTLKYIVIYIRFFSYLQLHSYLFFSWLCFCGGVNFRRGERLRLGLGLLLEAASDDDDVESLLDDLACLCFFALDFDFLDFLCLQFMNV